MHLFSTGSELRLRDLVSGNQWRWDGSQFNAVEPITCLPFQAYGFSFEQKGGVVDACDDESCAAIDIAEGTWPYAFAAANGGVVALTNYGGGLIFRDGRWCRMAKRGDAFECDPNQEMVTEPRKIQFYSSVRFEGQTLVGEWPTGRLYEFDGKSLQPIEHQPPFVSSEPIGYEAQSMAEYCGDLYVGYWPTGEVWRMDAKTREWALAVELFPRAQGTESFIPYLDRPAQTRDAAFYGRRVTALVVHEGSLFMTTSNLRGWETGYQPAFMHGSEIERYGATYRLHRPACSLSPN